MADVRDLRVVLLIDASNETVAALSDVVCDMLLKPILARLEVLHQGSDHRLAIVSYSIPSSPDGPDLSVTQDTFKSFQDSYNILRHGPLSVGLGRFSNLKGDSMALIDGFIQALKLCDGETTSRTSIYPIHHFIVITSHPPQITRRPPRMPSQVDSLVWENVPIALQKRGVNLSLIQTSSHPILTQLLCQTMGSSRFTPPWFPTDTYHVMLSGMSLPWERKVPAPQCVSDLRGTKRKHCQEHGLMGEDGATDDPSKRSRQVSSIGPFKCPLPRFQDNFAHGGADTAPPPSKPTAGLVASSRTIHPALPSREWYVSSQREAGAGALKTGAYSRFDGDMWASIGNNKGLDAEISPSVSPDQSLNWLSVQSNADEGSMGQAIIASGAGQGPHVAENAARHLPTIPDKTDGSDPHPMSVVTNNAQSWDPTTMIDSFPEPIGYPAPGLSSIASPATSPHPHHYPVDRDILCAQELTPSLLRSTTSQSHYQQPNVSSQLENPGASSNAQNGDYPTSREFYGASSPDYSEVPSPLWQGLNITQVSSKTTNTPQPPSGVNIMAPVREDSLDTLIRNLTAPVGAEPSSASGTSPLSENWSSITNRSGVAQHVSSSQSSPLPSGDEAGNDSIAAGTGSDEDFDEHKSMGILKLIMERAARKKGRERRERFKKKLKPGAAPNGGGASVEANHRRIAPHQPTSLQRTAQTWASPSPSITISRPESNPTEWYGHLIFDGEGLSDLEPIPVAISSPHLSVQDLPEAIYIHASDLRRPADWTSFHMFLGAHNVAIFPLRHYLASNGPKPLSGSSTVGYEPFLNMLYDNKMFASIEFSDRARGTGIAIFPWMGLSGCKLQVALFDHTRPLPTMEELASYVQNMGPSMMLPSHALGIREGTVDSPHTDSTSRTAQFAREMQHKQQQQFMVGSNPSSELSPSPVPYTSPSEQLLSFDQTVFGYSNYNNSAPQLLLEPASTSPFQLAGQLDTYHANSSSNEFDLSPTTYAQSNPASPSSVQYLGAPEEYSSPGYTQIPDADHSLYNSLMFNSSPMQDNGYAPQPGTENVYYGLENGHL